MSSSAEGLFGLVFGRGPRVLTLAVALVLLLLGAAQITLPRLAAERLRSRLSAHGHAVSVSVSAFPAIELLWHHADSVVVRMSSYGSSHARRASLGAPGEVGRERLVRRALKPFEDTYDRIMIDCPPSLGDMTINGLRASDDV